MDATQRNVALWTGILTAPIAWAIDLQLRFALVQYVCRNHAGWIMWFVTLIALIIAAFGAFCAWSGWGNDTPRVRFMAIGGMAISTMFALSIIAMAVPDLFLHACD